MNFVIVDDGEVTYHNPLGADKTAELEALLRGSGCFVPSFVGADPYSVETYIYEYAIEHTETIFLLDRNIYSQVIALAKGKLVDDKNRTAAAIMAFASCANANISPGLAIYEGSASGAKGGWRRDLALLHAADKINPINWASLALGIASHFDRKITRKKLCKETIRNFKPRLKLKSFGFVYPIVLKMALIQRNGGSCDTKMRELIRWMYLSWQFSSPAFLLAVSVLGKAPHKKVFKGIGSRDRARALLGVRNAAWDIVYITEWFQSIKKQAIRNELTILCTRDIALATVATSLLRVVYGFEEFLLLKEAGYDPDTIKLYQKCISNLKSNERALVPMPENVSPYSKTIVSKLEAEFLKQ